MKNKIIILLIGLSSVVSFAQRKITWDDLAKVKYEEKYFPDYGEYFLYPDFSDSVQALNGTKITVTGFFLDMDPSGQIFILSKGPLSSCFFCGVGGPETAIELRFNKKPDFHMNDIVSVTGTLRLNKEDVEHFNYILTDCVGEIAD